MANESIIEKECEIDGPKPDLIRLKTSRGSMLEVIVKSIDSICDYPLIEVLKRKSDLYLGEPDDQFRIFGMDEPRICIFDFQMKSEFWDNIYELPDSAPIFLPFDVIEEWFKLSAISEPHIELVLADGKLSSAITADGEPAENNEIPFDPADIDSERMPTTTNLEIDFYNTIRLPTIAFQKALKLFPLGNKKKPKFEEIYLEFSAKGLKLWGEVKKTGEHKETTFSPYSEGFECKAPGWCAFSNAYLHGIINIQPVSPEVTIHHSPSAPGKFDFTIAEPVGKKGFSDELGAATFYIACRVEADEDDYEND